jgi:hypothetical protein
MNEKLLQELGEGLATKTLAGIGLHGAVFSLGF